MAGRRALPIVVLRCLACGVELVGELRDGFVYATNRGQPPDAPHVEGHCPAHGGMTARHPVRRAP